MRILLVSLYLVEYAVELANALGEKNEVHLVLLKHRAHQTIGQQLNEKISNNVSYSLLAKHSWWSLSTWKSIYSIFKILLTFRYDIVHLQENSRSFNLFFLLLSFKPVVVTVHDVTLHPGSDASIKKARGLRVRKKLIKYCYDKVIVHGEKLKEEFIAQYKKPEQDVFVVPHGCLFSYLSHNNSKIPAEEPHTVLFFGRIEEYKGLKYLIETEPLVSRAIPDFKIIVAGNGQGMNNYRSKLSSNPHFEVHERFIPNTEVPFFFQRSSLVVLPYIEASQSGIVAMAFAFGKPVIVTDVGSLSEVVHDGKVGAVVPPRDAVRMASAIIDLLKDKERRRKMGKEALKLAETTLNWKHISSLTEEVYRAAL